MNKRGQAATEYLITYGWAFMAIIITVGALAYFGVINPSRFIPDRCSFGSQMECTDFLLDENGVHMYLRNNYGKDIIIENITGLNDKLTCTLQTIAAGDKREITCDVDPVLTKGSKKQIPMIIQFKRTDGTISHNVTGEIYSQVQ